MAKHSLLQMDNGKRMSPESIGDMLRKYVDGQTQVELSKEFGVDPAAVRYHLKKNNIAIRPAGDECRRISLNQNAFDEITEEAAYWIGFLMSDGCVTSKRNMLRLGLSSQDLGHLEKFKYFLGSGHKISHGKEYRLKGGETRHLVLLCITSAKITNRLAEFGVVDQKTFSAKVIGLENNRHFWRGVIDGDGCVYWRRRGDTTVELAGLRLAGSIDLMSQFRSYVQTVVPKCKVSVRPQVNIWSYSMGCGPATTVIDNLYSGSITHLDRKKKIADDVIFHCGRRDREQCRSLPF